MLARIFCRILLFSQTRKPFLQHAAISASMASRRPLDSLADVDMVNVAWVCFVPRPSAMSTASRRERGSRARATVTNQDLIVAPLKQTVAHAGEKSRATFDICSSAKACAASFMCVDVESCWF